METKHSIFKKKNATKISLEILMISFRDTIVQSWASLN